MLGWRGLTRAMVMAGRVALGGGPWHMVRLDPLLLAALAPLVLIDLAMVIYCIIDLYKPERRVRGGNKLVWLLVILLVSTLGWIVYLLAGREE